MNPIPHNAEVPYKLPHDMPSGNLANFTFIDNQQRPKIPSCLPANKPIAIPNLYFADNIKILWKILESIMDDWTDIKKPYEDEIRQINDQDQRSIVFGKHFIEIQPAYLKSLF